MEKEGGRVSKSFEDTSPSYPIMKLERKTNFIMFEAQLFSPSCYMESDLMLIDVDLPSSGSQSCKEDGHATYG